MRRWWHPTYLRERVRDALWYCSLPSRLEASALAWPVGREILPHVTLEWPETYQWAPMRRWGEQLRLAFARFVKVTTTRLPQPYKGVIRFALRYKAHPYHVNVEISDYPELNERAYDDADVHFKMQYQRQGYGRRDRLLPGGYLNNDQCIYRYLGRLRRLRDAEAPVHDVYGRFGLCLDRRQRALDVLTTSRAFRFFGGGAKVPYGMFLRELARSSIAVDLPGYGSLTFRLLDYLAVGSCVIAAPHSAKLHVPLLDRVHIVYCEPDYSDLEQLCVYYLTHPDERAALVQRSRIFFDSYLHRDQLAAYYLHHSLRVCLADGREVDE